MGGAMVRRGSGIMSKLMDALSEARWRGELSLSEYQWIVDNVVSVASASMYGEPMVSSLKHEATRQTRT